MKKIKLIALIVVIVMAFTGCMKEEANIKITTNGTVNYGIKIDIKTETLVEMFEKMGNFGLSKSDFVSELDAKNVTIDGEDYYEISESTNMTYRDFMKEYQVQGTSDAYVSEDTFYWKVNGVETILKNEGLDMETIELISGYNEKELEKLMQDIAIKFTVEFENEILNTNGAIDSEDSQKAVFDVAIDGNAKSYTMFATTNDKVTQDSIAKKIKEANTIKAPKIKKLKANKAKKNSKNATITVKFGKVSGAKKYKVQYSTKKNFKNSKQQTTKKTTVKLTKLDKGTKYFVRVYAMKTNHAGQTVTSKASTRKSVKTKK